jgi:soluble lytic murein transglycosylase
VQRLFSTCLTLCLAYIAAYPLPAADELKKIKAAVESRDYGAAVQSLLQLEAADPKAFLANDYYYLLGRSAEANGDFATAAYGYQKTAMQGSLLRPYALAHLSRIARSTGNLMLERLYLLELLSPDSPHIVLMAPAAVRLAGNSFETGNFGTAISILEAERSWRKPLTAGTNDSSDRDMLALLGDAYLKFGNAQRAGEIFSGIINSTKDLSRPDDAAARSCNALDILDGGTKAKAPEIALDEHLRRATVFQANRDFAQARQHYEAIAAIDVEGANAAEALFQIGRGLSQQNEFAEALEFYSRVLDQYPEKPAAKDALLQSASANARLQEAEKAIKLYQRFITAYPADEKLDRAYLNIVDILRDKGSDDEALDWCRKTESNFNGKKPEAVAIFTEARIYLARGEWQNSLDCLHRLETMKDLGGASVPGGSSKDEVAFLSAYCLEQQGSFAEAIENYLLIPDGRDSYYGWRATERLKLMTQLDVARLAILLKLESVQARLDSQDPEERRRAGLSVLRLTDDKARQDRAITVIGGASKNEPVLEPILQEIPFSHKRKNSIGSRLLSLALYDESAPEMEAAEEITDAHTLAMLYSRGDRADHGIRYVEPVMQKVAADVPIELISDYQLDMLYPTPYADLVRKYSAQHGVDPRFLLSIMRQESRFDPNARSGAAARGLMQFISSTSQKLGTELGFGRVEPEDVYDPGTSILFGAQYLSDLFKLFPDKPEAVAAAYNAGEENMPRWLGRARSQSPEQYVSEIVYAQSKDYVHKVMTNYRMYCFLYEIDLQPISH